MSSSVKPKSLIKIHIMVDKYAHARFTEVWGNTIGVSKAIRIAMDRLLADHEARTRAIIDKRNGE